MGELVAKGITKVKEIIEKIRKRFFPSAVLEIEEAITCEDILPAKTCADLRAAAEKLKVKVEEIDAIVRELVKEKITKAKEIIKRVREKIVDLAKNFKCTDILSEKVCTKIYEIAEKLKVKAAAVTKFLKELVAKGITKMKDIIEQLRKKFFPGVLYEIEGTLITYEAVTCEDFLPAETCAELRAAAEKLKVKVEEIDAIVRELVK